MAIGKEQVEQIIVMDWVRFHKLEKVVLHIPNERRCSPQHGAILKRMGVMKGASDLFIARASRGFHGAWLEMKAEKGKLSPSQKEFLERMATEGYFTACRFGAKETISTIEHYLQMT